MDQYFGGVLAQQDLHQDLFNGTIPDLYSCHKCDTGGEIPFIHKTLLGDITPYNITEDIPSDGTGGNLLVCRDPSNPAHFGLEELTGFPQECALGLAAVDQSLETGLYPTLTCLACNSGFTP
ncbi:MAG: hypothetical protein DHS20C09_17160 [marine bacterium B5-7]|nr:MAG: hypothetical protein DHS20C09_17160 [marine bacterium B5-7]